MVDWKMQNQDEKKSQSRSLSRSAPPCTEHTSALSLLAAVVAKHSNGLLHSGEPDQKSHVGNCVCVWLLHTKCLQEQPPGKLGTNYSDCLIFSWSNLTKRHVQVIFQPLPPVGAGPLTAAIIWWSIVARTHAAKASGRAAKSSCKTVRVIHVQYIVLFLHDATFIIIYIM